MPKRTTLAPCQSASFPTHMQPEPAESKTQQKSEPIASQTLLVRRHAGHKPTASVPGTYASHQTPGMLRHPASHLPHSNAASVVKRKTQPQTPSGVFPHTPLLLPQLMLLMFDSLAPVAGLDAAEVERSLAVELAAAVSLGAKP